MVYDTGINLLHPYAWFCPCLPIVPSLSLQNICLSVCTIFLLYADTMGAYSSGELAEKFSEAGVDANS